MPSTHLHDAPLDHGRVDGAGDSALREAHRRAQMAELREQGARRRLLQMQQATERLALAMTSQHVAEILVSVGESVLGAAAVVVYLVEPNTRELVLAASSPVDGLVARWRVLPLDAPLPLATAVRTGEPAWLSNPDELVASYPNLGAVPPALLQAAVALPLLQGGRAIGGLALSFGRSQVFEEDDREWLRALAAQGALAAERARLYEAEQRARSEAETLFRIAESLNATQLDLEALIQRVTDEATVLVGARFGAFFYNDVNERGESYALYTLSGAPKEAFARFGLPRKTAIFAPTFDGVGVVRIDDVTKDPRYGRMSPHHGMPAGHLPVTSYLAVPVISSSGAVIGGLLFGHPEPGRFGEAHERMVKALAATAAAAIDNARLFRASRDAAEAERSLATQMTETVRLNELLAGVLAHDLRNPLSAIITGAHLAIMKDQRRPQDQRIGQVLERILGSGQRMSRMVDQLLDVSRIRLGAGMRLDPRELDLVDLLGQVVDEFGADPAASVRLEHQGDGRGSWDPDRLSQVFSNLVGNALQHGLNERGVQVLLDGSDPTQVRVEVHNAGAIEAKLLPKLFDPLAAGERRRDGSRGLGLGLFISSEIAKAHGGRVTVTSSEAACTHFAVTLPRGR